MSSLAAPPPSATLATNERVQARIAAGRARAAPRPSARPACRSCPASPSAWARRPARTATAPSRAPRRCARRPPATSSGAGCRRAPIASSSRPAARRCSTRCSPCCPGDVVLPRPSWVSYAAQAALAGKRVLDVPIAEQAGGVPDPAALRERARRRRGPAATSRRSSSSRCPTTRRARSRRRRSSRRCATWPREHGLLIVCDEIYRDLAYEPEALRQPRHAAARERRSSPTG